MCFQFAENYLPDDLSEKIREAIKKIEEINMQVTLDSLHFMLSSVYQTNFNETYSIPDMREFKRIIRQYYEGNISGEKVGNKMDLPKFENDTNNFAYRPKMSKISESAETLREYRPPAPAFRRFYKTHGRLPSKEEYIKFKKENGEPFTPRGAEVQFGFLKTWLNKNKSTEDW
jgi:hypothetical protein